MVNALKDRDFPFMKFICLVAGVIITLLLTVPDLVCWNEYVS